jgi:integrase
MNAVMSLHPIEGTLMAAARDLFVFQMFTGMGYSDTQKFDLRDYKKVNGKWINTGNRVKTGEAYIAHLLPPVVEVLERYGMQTPKINNADYNHALKAIQYAAGITTRLHSHLGRHSFATYMLSNDVPIQNVQQMLGHKDIRQTQRYAKVLAEDVHENFDEIEEKMKKKASMQSTDNKQKKKQ